RSRITKKPEPIRRRLAASSPRCSLANSRFKRVLRFSLIAGHQKTKPVKLRQNFAKHRHARPWLTAKWLQRLQPTRHLISVFTAVKRRDSEKALATRSKPASWRNNHIKVVQHSIEHLPTGHASGCLHPNVRRIYSSINT